MYLILYIVTIYTQAVTNMRFLLPYIVLAQFQVYENLS